MQPNNKILCFSHGSILRKYYGLHDIENTEIFRARTIYDKHPIKKYSPHNRYNIDIDRTNHDICNEKSGLFKVISNFTTTDGYIPIDDRNINIKFKKKYLKYKQKYLQLANKY